MVITELDEDWVRTRTKKLSALQRELLARGLRAHEYERPFFTVATWMQEVEARRVRASKRAAAGRAIARLIARGLLECCGRGKWRLTRVGLDVVLRLYPDHKPPSAEELAHIITLRKLGEQAGLGRKRRRARTTAKL